MTPYYNFLKRLMANRCLHFLNKPVATSVRFPLISSRIVKTEPQKNSTAEGAENKCNHEEHPELNERTHLTGQAKKN